MLRLNRVTKRFGDLLANDDISLSVAPGEVLGLLGENGAGKSTLMSILFGQYRADSGSIEVEGKQLPPGDTRAALAAGIGMVHQHFMLAENLSVLDNVMLGHESLWSWRSSRARFRERLFAAAQDYGLVVDPDARVRDLSVGERQRVEILKALLRGARYLILDEPTAVLTPGEVEHLFATLRSFIAKGLAVIFISHKLGEVLAICDRVVVLRGGRLVDEVRSAQASPAALALSMIGRAIDVPENTPTNPASNAEAHADRLLQLDTVDVRMRRQTLLHEVDLLVHAGEILAVAGVAGNGQQALADLLSGLLAPSQGSIRVFGRNLSAAPASWVGAGIARIPEDRLALGVVGDGDLLDNAALPQVRAPKFSRWPQLSKWLHVLDRKKIRAHAQTIVQRYDVRCRSLDQSIKTLSGGNVQKFILGREMSNDPRLVIANQPTWGLDIGAVTFVHEQLRGARSRGAAVVLISEDLDEIFAIADRITVIHRGRLTPARSAQAWSRHDIGLAMAGQAAT